MRVEIRLFLLLVPFFLIAGLAYGLLSDWEIVGSLAIPITGGMVAMIGSYLLVTSKRIDERPEDDPDGQIEQGAGEQGVFAPWSWWPLMCAIAAAVTFTGMAVGWWLMLIGAGIGVIALVGWVFEFSRGQHAH